MQTNNRQTFADLRVYAITLFAFAIALSTIVPNAVAQSTPTSNTAAKVQPWSVGLKKTVVFLTVVFQDGTNIGRAEGTGFFVNVPDDRLGKGTAFRYFVTNRHMADPSIAIGHPVRILGYEISANRIMAANSGDQRVTFQMPSPHWTFSSDPSVDLAVTPLSLNQAKIDYLSIPESMFATKDVVKSQEISEGDSVVFTGFFAQFPGQKRIEPVIREGILAMLPEEKIPTTLRLPGDLYLADLHSFHGNSGSPVFVNMNGFRNGSVIFGGPRFLLLGILSGYMYETADLQLQAATTLVGRVGANSGITTIVPVDELKAILNCPELQQQRDTEVAHQHK